MNSSRGTIGIETSTRAEILSGLVRGDRAPEALVLIGSQPEQKDEEKDKER